MHYNSWQNYGVFRRLGVCVKELCGILTLGIKYVIDGVCAYVSLLEDIDFRCFYIKIRLSLIDDNNRVHLIL